MQSRLRRSGSESVRSAKPQAAIRDAVLQSGASHLEQEIMEQRPPQRLVPLERSPRPIDPGVDIGHVHLRTADIERVHRFYVGILGFDVTARMPDALFIAAGGY